jgi:hypothetical protein
MDDYSLVTVRMFYNDGQTAHRVGASERGE